MAEPQDKSVQGRKGVGELSEIAPSLRAGERTRVMKDGTHLSFQERLDYAMSLVPTDRWQSHFGRSRKQIRRYLEGADVPISFIFGVAAASGVPSDWIVGGRPSFGPSDFDLWRLSLPSPPRNYVPSSPEPSHPDDFDHLIEKHDETADDWDTRPDFPEAGGKVGRSQPAPAPPETAERPLFGLVKVDRLVQALRGAQASSGGDERLLAHLTVLLYDQLTEADAARSPEEFPQGHPQKDPQY